MLLLKRLDIETLENLSNDLTLFAKRHGLKSCVNLQLASDDSFDQDSPNFRSMSYNPVHKVIILWGEGLWQLERVAIDGMARTLARLPDSQQEDPNILDSAFELFIHMKLAGGLSHEIKHQIDQDRSNRINMFLNWFSTLRLRVKSRHPLVVWFCRMLYVFSPLEVRARNYAKRHQEEYLEIVKRHIRLRPD